MKSYKQLVNQIKHLNTAHASLGHAQDGLIKTINRAADFEVNAIIFNYKKDAWFVDVSTNAPSVGGLIGNRFIMPLDFIKAWLRDHDTISYDDYHSSIFAKGN